MTRFSVGSRPQDSSGCAGTTSGGTASLLIAQGDDLRIVMKILGHSTISLMADTYAHVSAALLDTARDALDRALPTHNTGALRSGTFSTC